MPFNGPDAGGFGGDTTDKLITDWFKAGFLFPFFRNHANNGSRQQEPWAFDKETMSILRHYVRLRYRFRPYLYQLFIENERTGEAILRPLFYDFEDSPDLPLGLVDDQFMVGPSLMQAPFVTENQTTRNVLLPGDCHWWAVDNGKWLKGGQKIRVKATPQGTPIYIRDGSILPLARQEPHDNLFSGDRIDFHIFLVDGSAVTTRYLFDDGATFAYRQGKRSEIEVSAKRSGKRLTIQVNTKSSGFGEGDFTFTADRRIKEVCVNGVLARNCPPQGVGFGIGETATWAV
jgi:alpha-glucosidase